MLLGSLCLVTIGSFRIPLIPSELISPNSYCNSSLFETPGDACDSNVTSRCFSNFVD
jgi:hypothetical protein